MKLLKYSLALVAGAGLGLTVGFVLRSRPNSNTAESAATTAASTTEPAGSENQATHRRVPFNDDSPLATRLERDLSMSTGVTRWLYWLDAIEKAAPSDFPRLLQVAQGNPAAERLVADRWIELYPRHAFDSVIAAMESGGRSPVAGLANQLLRDWVGRDPDAAIAALKESRDFGSLSNWRDTLAAAVIEKDPERGLLLFCEWTIDHFGPRMNGVSKWAAADPRHAAQFALDHPSGYVSQMTMETIAKEWARTDPRAALEFAAASSGDLNAILGNVTLKEWARKNLNAAAEWLAKTDDATRGQLSPAFVEAWAGQDSAAALAWCEANLTGSKLADAVAGVMSGAAEKNVSAAADLVSAMNPSSARAKAAAVVAKKWLPNSLVDKPASPETIAWLNNLDAESVKRVLEDVDWQWMASDPKSLAAFLATKNTVASSDTYTRVARELARKNPTEAMEWAAQLPESQALTAGGEAFAEWRVRQSESAMKWLNALPATDPRRAVFLERSIHSLVWDPRAPEQFAAMPAPERTIARAVVEGTTSISPDRRALLLEALK